MKANEIINFIRGANNDLGQYLQGLPDEELPAQWLQKWSLHLAWQMYREGPHWHTVRNECVEVTPFEVQMQALALLASWWCTDIFERKARDRGAPAMSERSLEFSGAMIYGIVQIRDDVKTHRDPESEAAYRATPGGQGRRGSWWRLRHKWNTWRWGH